jgi:hypothetical protein
VRDVDRAWNAKLSITEHDKSAVDIGSPSHCYQMVLTDDGRNLKSAIVSELTRVFGNVVENDVATTKASKPVMSKAKAVREARLQSRDD